MADPWHYRVEPFRWLPGEAAWKPAPESAADAWFVWGQQGDDRRCLGLYASRAAAARALDEARQREPEALPLKDEPRDRQRRLEGFHATLAEHRSGSGTYTEDGDHILRHWQELSPERKLSYLAFDAAYFAMPVERLAEAVRDLLSDQPPEARENALLSLLLERERELQNIAQILPDGGRAEPSPIIGRLRQWMGLGSGDGQALPADRQPPAGAADRTEKVYAVEHVPDGRFVVWNRRDLEPEDIFPNEAMARACAQQLNRALQDRAPQRSQSTVASPPGTPELSAALFSDGAGPPTEGPQIPKESRQQEPGRRR